MRSIARGRFRTADHYSRGAPGNNAKHDIAELAAIAARLGLDVAIDMEALDAYLGAQGWRPPASILQQLAADNHWIHHHFGADGGAASRSPS